jgi:hypothetical protein
LRQSQDARCRFLAHGRVPAIGAIRRRNRYFALRDLARRTLVEPGPLVNSAFFTAPGRAAMFKHLQIRA